MKVLVTGAAGFLASRIIKELVRRGEEVVGLDVRGGDYTAGARYVVADIVDPKLPAHVDGPFDCVIHMAAVAAPLLCESDPRRALDINVTGTLNVLKLAVARGAQKFVFASSAHVYGISPRYMPTDERHPLWLQDTYTTSKLLGEKLCELFSDNHGISCTVLRLFNGYGPGQSAGYFIPDMIAKAKAGRIEMKGARVTKDFVFVDDVVRAFVAATTTLYSGAVNIGSGRETTLSEVATIIANRMRVPLELLDYPPDRDTRMWCDPARAARVLNWTPETDLEVGMEATLRGI